MKVQIAVECNVIITEKINIIINTQMELFVIVSLFLSSLHIITSQRLDSVYWQKWIIYSYFMCVRCRGPQTIVDIAFTTTQIWKSISMLRATTAARNATLKRILHESFKLYILFSINKYLLLHSFHPILYLLRCASHKLTDLYSSSWKAWYLPDISSNMANKLNYRTTILYCQFTADRLKFSCTCKMCNHSRNTKHTILLKIF